VLGGCESPLERGSLPASYTRNGALEFIYTRVEAGDDTVDVYRGADTLVLFADGTGEWRGTTSIERHRGRPELNSSRSAYWPFTWRLGDAELFGEAVWVRAATCGTRGCGDYNGEFWMRIHDGPVLEYHPGQYSYRQIGPPTP
jgi:hypothetical protein